MRPLTYSRLLEAIKYNPVTGVFTWKISTNNRVKIGQVCTDRDGKFPRVHLDGKYYYLAVLAHLYMYGEFPDHTIYYKNGDTSDLRWCNIDSFIMPPLKTGREMTNKIVIEDRPKRR